MSKYTTGELAKICGVTVRTVQYYDARGILIPSELSEGGRRLYSEDDLKRMKVICFLREMDLPIDAISQILREEHPEKVISLLIEQQEKALSDEISAKQEKPEETSLDDDPDRDPGHGPAVVLHYFLDPQRHMVAVCHLGTGGRCLGDPGEPVQFSPCQIYLPRMP